MTTTVQQAMQQTTQATTTKGTETMNVNTAPIQVTFIPRVCETESRFKAKKGSDAQSARPKIKWTYAGFAANSPEAIAINSALEDFGRKLIAENGSDWNYSPNPETCNVEELQAYLERERAGWTRTVTKETLAACAAYYREAAQRILGKSETAASAGATLIMEKLKAAQGSPDVARVFRGNLISLIEGETDLTAIEPHAAVIEKLLEMLEDMETSQTVDAEAL